MRTIPLGLVLSFLRFVYNNYSSSISTVLLEVFLCLGVSYNGGYLSFSSLDQMSSILLDEYLMYKDHFL